MRIYFAGAIRAGRDLQAAYAAIVEHLKRSGHVVLTEHVAAPGAEAVETGLADAQIYSRDVAWLDGCDAVVAEVTVPSLGVGYEIGYALHHACKPVLCLCVRGAPLSAMIQGNDTPNLQVAFYGEISEAQRSVETFLQQHFAGR